ncbi:MAG TPA: DNA translocase FtsK 4TM domain-containing protein, partial [Opitutaceae bacterium]
MPKSDSSNPNGGPSFQGPRYRPNWFAAGLCLIAGLYLTAALVDYDPAQTKFHSTTPLAKNWVGWLGADTVNILFTVIGVSTWLIPIALFWMFYVAVRNSRHLVATRVSAIVIGIFAMTGLLAMFENVKANDTFPHEWGGLTGKFLYQRMLQDALGPFGTALLLGTIYCCALLFVITKDIGAEVERIMANFGEWRAERSRRKAALAEELAKRRDDRVKGKNAVLPPLPPLPNPPVGPSGSKKFIVAKAADDPLSRSAARPPVGGAPDVVAKPEPKLAVKAQPKAPLTIVKPEEPKKAKATPFLFDASYKAPPTSLLKEQVKSASGNSDEEHQKNSDALIRILGEFGVEVTPGEIHVGPVITCYEVVPAPGVRVEKISGLDKNIALGM